MQNEALADAPKVNAAEVQVLVAFAPYSFA